MSYSVLQAVLMGPQLLNRVFLMCFWSSEGLLQNDTSTSNLCLKVLHSEMCVFTEWVSGGKNSIVFDLKEEYCSFKENWKVASFHKYFYKAALFQKS